MSWQKWVLLAIIAVTGLCSIGATGRKVNPAPPSVAVAAVAVDIAMAWLVITA